jgi:acyl carrier protein
MVPSTFVVLGSLPMTPNGKLDRNALPAPDGVRPELERNYVAPSGPIEEALASIWCQVLAIDRAWIDDDFFDLGGHSLLAVKMLALLEDSVGVTLPLRVLFDRTTIRELAQAVTAELLGGAESDDLAQLLSEAEAAGS